MDLAGKVALVSGGSGDIGGAIARALALAGGEGALTYVGSGERASATAETGGGSGRRAPALQLGQRGPPRLRAIAREGPGAFGQLDILVNNAAWNIGIPFADLEALNRDVWDRILETNLRGPYLLARAFAGELRRHKAGRIVNIASLAGLTPGGSSIAYAASKAALIHRTHCLAIALAREVTVNCIAPGLVDGTRMAARVPEPIKQEARSRAVLGRTGSARDIADQVVTFCRAESVTGQVIVVDGGMPEGMR